MSLLFASSTDARFPRGTIGTGPYEGLVATGGRMLFNNTASFNQAMGRSEHVAGENLSSIKLIFSNFYGQNPDSGQGATATVTASIEYPAATVTRVTFAGGSTSASIPNISTATSDYITVSIPAGATFWVRIYYTNPNGLVYKGNQPTPEQFAVAVSGLADQTMSGSSITGGTSQTWSMPPLAIIGMTRNPSICVVGDSRSENNLGSPSQGIITPSLVNANAMFVDLAVSSARAYQWVSFAAARDVVLSYCSQVILNLGINDLSDGQTAAQIVTNIQAIFALSSARYKYGSTIQPYTTDPGTPQPAWTTTAQQTPAVTVSTLNDLIRAGFSGMNGFYEIADLSESARNSNKWIVTPSPPYTVDGLHANSAGNNLVTTSGIIVPAPYP